MNGFSFVVPFIVFFMKDIYGKYIYYTQILFIIFLISSQNLFISGKFIVILTISALWLISKTKQRIYTYILFLLIILFSEPIFNTIKNNFSSNYTISWKIQQLEEGLLAMNSGNFEAEGSFGNILNEGKAIITYFNKEGIQLFTGMGMGGGVPDNMRTLAPLAGNSGYALEDQLRNNYFTMHISILDVFLKAGFIWLIFFVFLLIKQFKHNDLYGLMSFILFFTVFYTSKEMMLLTLLFFSITLKNEDYYEKSAVFTE